MEDWRGGLFLTVFYLTTVMIEEDRNSVLGTLNFKRIGELEGTTAEAQSISPTIHNRFHDLSNHVKAV